MANPVHDCTALKENLMQDCIILLHSMSRWLPRQARCIKPTSRQSTESIISYSMDDFYSSSCSGPTCFNLLCRPWVPSFKYPPFHSGDWKLDCALGRIPQPTSWSHCQSRRLQQWHPQTHKSRKHLLKTRQISSARKRKEGLAEHSERLQHQSEV